MLIRIILFFRMNILEHSDNILISYRSETGSDQYIYNREENYRPIFHVVVQFGICISYTFLNRSCEKDLVLIGLHCIRMSRLDLGTPFPCLSVYQSNTNDRQFLNRYTLHFRYYKILSTTHYTSVNNLKKYFPEQSSFLIRCFL